MLHWNVSSQLLLLLLLWSSLILFLSVNIIIGKTHTKWKEKQLLFDEINCNKLAFPINCQLDERIISQETIKKPPTTHVYTYRKLHLHFILWLSCLNNVFVSPLSSSYFFTCQTHCKVFFWFYFHINIHQIKSNFTIHSFVEWNDEKKNNTNCMRCSDFKICFECDVN